MHKLREKNLPKMAMMCLDDKFVYVVCAPDGRLRWSEPFHCQHNKTCHTQCHMKHTPVVQFQTLSGHFLKGAYFRRPKDTSRINKANIFDLCKRLILWGMGYHHVNNETMSGEYKDISIQKRGWKEMNVGWTKNNFKSDLREMVKLRQHFQVWHWFWVLFGEY